MSLLGIIGAIGGVAASVLGASEAREAARERERQIKEQRAKTSAWYNRNYYADYLNDVAAVRAINRVRDAMAERTREARARQAVSGGTPEQAEAVAEAGGDAVAATVGNLAAQGDANKRQVDAQKMAMDANLAAQDAAIADARQQAGANLIDNGIGVATSALSSIGNADNTASKIKPVEINGTSTEGEVKLNNGMVVPEKINVY